MKRSAGSSVQLSATSSSAATVKPPLGQALVYIAGEALNGEEKQREPRRCLKSRQLQRSLRASLAEAGKRLAWKTELADSLGEDLTRALGDLQQKASRIDFLERERSALSERHLADLEEAETGLTTAAGCSIPPPPARGVLWVALAALGLLYLAGVYLAVYWHFRKKREYKLCQPGEA